MYHYNVIFYITPEGYPNEKYYIDTDFISCSLTNMLEALGLGDIWEWNKKSMEWIAEKSNIAKLTLQTIPFEYKQYESEFGWDVNSMIDFLNWVFETAVEHPYAKIQVEYC